MANLPFSSFYPKKKLIKKCKTNFKITIVSVSMECLLCIFFVMKSQIWQFVNCDCQRKSSLPTDRIHNIAFAFRILSVCFIIWIVTLLFNVNQFEKAKNCFESRICRHFTKLKNIYYIKLCTWLNIHIKNHSHFVEFNTREKGTFFFSSIIFLLHLDTSKCKQ